MDNTINLKNQIFIDKFIKVDGNQVVNVEFIRWIEKKDECLSICSKMDGCGDYGVSRVCRISNPNSYDYLLKLFQ